MDNGTNNTTIYNTNTQYNPHNDYMNTDYNIYASYDAYNDHAMDFATTNNMMPTNTNNNMMIYNAFTPQDRSILIDLVETLKKNKWAPAFLQPVDPVAFGIPDYFDVIKEPMDLNTASAKLKQEPCPYFSREEAIRDIQLIFDNCYLYNNKTDPVCFQAKKLEEVFKKGLLKLPEKCEKVLNNQPVEMMPDDHWRRCEAIIKEMKKPKYARFTWPFAIPVDPKLSGASDYFNVIKYPMDMSTCEKKLYDFEYKSEEELADDIRLMLNNCYTYNPPGHEIRANAIEFDKVFEEQWAKLHGASSGSTAKRASTGAAPPKSKKKKSTTTSSSSKKQSSQYHQQQQQPQPQPQQLLLQQPHHQPLQQQQQHNDPMSSQDLLLLDPTSMMLDTTGFADALPYHTPEAFSAMPPLLLSTTSSSPVVSAEAPPPTAMPPVMATAVPAVAMPTVQTAIPLTAVPGPVTVPQLPPQQLQQLQQQQQLPQLKLHVQPQQPSPSNTTISLPTSSFSSTNTPVTSSPEDIAPAPKPVEEKKQGSTILRLKLKMPQPSPEEKEATPSPSTSKKVSKLKGSK
jgi:hypothetical protein